MANKEQLPVSDPHTSADGDSGLLQKKELGRYQLQKKLGAGGMGAVYLALDTQLNRLVALKILPPEKAENAILVRRFKAEAQAVAQLTHENIVRVYESGEVNGYHYIALEYVEGTDVHRLIKKRGRLPVRRATEIVSQVAMALEHANQAGIVHRDIKPANMLISQTGVVKLTDLGLARVLDENEETSITRAGTTVGTVDYMAPEQARSSKAADVRSDIYSLGCAWYHMLTGMPPYSDGSVTNKLHAHVTAAIPDPRLLNDAIPETIVGVIQRMMAKKPEDRYETPQELLEDLKAVKLSKKEVSADDLAALARGDDEELEEAQDALAGSVGRLTVQKHEKQPLIPKRERSEQPVEATPQSSKKKNKSSKEKSMPPRERRKLDDVAPQKEPLNLQPLLYFGGIVGLALLIGFAGYVFSGVGRSITQEEPPTTLQTATEQVQEERQQEQAGNQPVGEANAALLKVAPEQPEKKIEQPTLMTTPSAGETVEVDNEPPPTGLMLVAKEQQWPVIRVLEKGEKLDEKSAYSIAEALTKSTDNQLVIELHTTGMHPWTEPVILDGRTVILRSAAGATGMILVDSAEALKKGLITIRNAELLLHRLHFGLLGYNLAGPDELALIKAIDADVTVQNSTFTLEETLAKPVLLCQLTQTNSRRSQVRWEHSLVRGTDWKAFDFQAWSGRLVLQDSLFLLGDQPLLTLNHPAKPAGMEEAASEETPFYHREIVIQDSLVLHGQATALVVNNTLQELNVPATQFQLQRASFLASSRTGNKPFLSIQQWPENVLKSTAAGNAELSYLSWSSEGSSFTGWQERLTAVTDRTNARFSANNNADWARFWGVENLPEQWDKTGIASPGADVVAHGSAEILQTAGWIKPAQVSEEVRDRWQQIPLPVLKEPTWRAAAMWPLGEAPQPASPFTRQTPRLKVDVNRQDLGEFLSSQDLPETVVVEARGFGLRTSSPIRVNGKHVRIEFLSEKGRPQLTFRPVSGKEENAAGSVPWVRVENGLLELSGGVFRLDPPAKNPLPSAWLAAVDSEVTLHRCYITGPQSADNRLEALIKAGGTGEQHWLNLNETYLQYGGTLLDVDLQRQKLNLAGSVLASPKTLMKLRHAGEENTAAGQFNISHCTFSLGEQGIQFEVAARQPHRQPWVNGFVKESVFVPTVTGESNSVKPVLFTTQDGAALPERVWWWGKRNGFAPQVARTAQIPDLAAVWENSFWGKGHIQQPLFGAQGVILKTGSVDPKQLKPGAYSLFEKCTAATWGTDEKPIGADCAALDITEATEPEKAPGTPTQVKPSGTPTAPRF